MKISGGSLQQKDQTQFKNLAPDTCSVRLRVITKIQNIVVHPLIQRLAFKPPLYQLEINMTISLLLTEGSGTIFENEKRSSDAAPLMVGYVEFLLNKERGQKLKLEVAVWMKERANETKDKFYSLSIGGINASLFKESDKKENGPDYAGSFGFNQEMRIAGWKKDGVNGGKPFISLSISPKLKDKQTPAPNQAKATGSATPPQGNEIETGLPDFKF